MSMGGPPSPAEADSRRLVGLCVSFFVLFFSFYGSQTQVTPTLGSFGSLSLGLLYGCLALTAPLAPAVLRCLGCGAPRRSLRAEARALAMASLLYVPFMVACSDASRHHLQLATSAILGCAAGLLWVAQGSLLTASTTASNRGRWSGTFWAMFMAGNSLGNFSAAAIVGATSVSTMFLVLAGVCLLSSMLLVLLVRPRRMVPSFIDAYADPLVSSDRGGGGGNNNGGGGGGGGSGGDGSGGDNDDSASLFDDLQELLRALCQRESLSLLPLLIFIGAENAFWSGEFASLASRFKGGAGGASLAAGTLAAAEIAASLVAGVAVDRDWPTFGLIFGLVAFCAALVLIQLCVVPQLAPVADRADEPRLPWTAFLAAALMGIGDAAANTVVTARLGSLADEHGLFKREAAFQYFQSTNVAMMALAFVYAPYAPLELGAPPVQPVGLCALALLGVVAFHCGLRSRRAPPPGRGSRCANQVNYINSVSVHHRSASGGPAEASLNE